ncbi:MAG: hypothetical protein MRERV_4c096 [Mycoplasmataceae bacterium RV_VA103A]|nr:MAG: hypothetical protein MRERV_11c051 [Mycoplasmataceae bacterium RV_VA103A]KLL05186.1 MAG: hypothetical protein MRERV_4c096 [Mycoplasmataceae bacterium RV_VA103A]
MKKNKITAKNPYQMLVDPAEEKIVRWVESDACLGSRVIGPEASTLEKIKYELCQNIVRYKREKKLDLKQMSRLFKLDELTANKLLHYHIENFSLDSLISYVEKLNIACQVKITPQADFTPIRKIINHRPRKHL